LLLDVHHSILKILVNHNAYSILGRYNAMYHNFHLHHLLPLLFRLLNTKNVYTQHNHNINYPLKLIRKRPYITAIYTQPTRFN
jgi:hypothetical protein